MPQLLIYRDGKLVQATAAEAAEALAALGAAAAGHTHAELMTASERAKLAGLPDAAALAGSLAGKASLVGGKLDPAQVPDIALQQYLGAVATEAAMLALVGQAGDWCSRSDTGTDWRIVGDPSTLAGWLQTSYPSAPVSSVNGRSGAVVLTPADIGAATVSQGAAAESAVQPGDLGPVATMTLAQAQAAVLGAGRYTAQAGVKSAPTSAITYGARTSGTSGWGFAFVRDPDLAFDTITIPGLQRGAGLTGASQWASIVLEVVDLSTSFAGEVIARSSIAVDPAADTLGALTFPMLDLQGRSIVLDDESLPSRFVVRHYALNAGGGRAICSEVRTATPQPFALRTTQGQSAGPAGGTSSYAVYQDLSSGNWGVNGMIPGMAYTFTLSSDRALLPNGSPLLRNTLARLARLLDGNVVQASILMFGDSWVHGNARFARPIARAMKARYGDAGPGWLGFTMAFGAVPAGGADDAQASLVRSGAWADDLTTSAKGCDAYSCSAGTVGDSITITIGGTARRAVLHGWTVAGGGSVRWQLNGGAWSTISMDAASGMQLTAIDFGADVTGATLVIEVLTMGAGVTLHGIDLRRDAAGVRVHKMGHSGGRAAHHYGVAEAITWAEVASLDPVLCLLCWTTNEINANVAPAAMAADIEGLMRRLRQVRPYIDFLIVSPFDNASEANLNRWSDYESALMTLAAKWRVPFFSTRALVGTWGDANARGLMQDNIPHPASPGGHLLSGVLMRDHLTLGL